MTQTFSLHSIGCRLNQYEIEAIGVQLESLGFQQVPWTEPADFTVINTCTVTARADADARNAVRRARRRSPGGRIIVTGCYVQAQPEAVEALDAADLLIDNTDKERLVERLVAAFGYALPGGAELEARAGSACAVDRFTRHTRAMVKVQDGCQEACTYCIIPRARGRERSRAPEEILREVGGLEANGYKEVVLTGVHVGKYRHGDWRLVDLVRQILRDTGIPQIRLTSMEPREFRPALVDLLVSEPRCCPHLHIPLQSGDDDTLRAMRRSYDTALVQELLGHLTQRRPDMAVGTDVITGFPTETPIQFERTVALIETLPLAYLHVFSYSDRPGTAAAAMDRKVPPHEVRARTRRLRAVSRRLRRAFVGRFEGRTLPVLIERRRDAGTGLLVGMSNNYLRVLVAGPDHWMNQIVPLRIVGCEGEMAIAEAA